MWSFWITVQELFVQLKAALKIDPRTRTALADGLTRTH